MNRSCDNPVQILYYGAGWPTNIGNAFIDLGAMAILNTAVPEAQVAFASEMPRWFFANPKNRPLSSKLLKGRNPPPTTMMERALDMAAISHCDFVAFSGMAMCRGFIEVNGPTIIKLAQSGKRVILLGTGGLEYDKEEEALFRDFLAKVQPVAFISRDDRSYETYAPYVENNHRGIDCGFFVSEAYQPLTLHLSPYVVSTFDGLAQPDIDVKDRQLVYAHHECWGALEERFVEKEHTLISDIPQDYLTLYANAEEVHTDRVHACVATLAYGNATRLYHPTPRGSLFDAVGANRIRDALVELDMDLLKQKKETQVAFVRDLIQSYVVKS